MMLVNVDAFSQQTFRVVRRCDAATSTTTGNNRVKLKRRSFSRAQTTTQLFGVKNDSEIDDVRGGCFNGSIPSFDGEDETSKEFFFRVPVETIMPNGAVDASAAIDYSNIKPEPVDQRWVQLAYLSLLALLSDWVCFSVAAAPETFESNFGNARCAR